MTQHTCPACGNSAMSVFYEQARVPTNSCILLETVDEATGYPCGDIELGFCDSCGFISNLAFDSKLTEYSGRYEETQGFSETFNTFHHALAQRLVDEYDLKGKRVLEIGCGKGEFLKMICEIGQNEGVGFDPGFRPDRLELAEGEKIEFVQDFYSEKYASHSADFVCCKMTLEHISDTGDFIGTIRRAIGDDDSFVFFQIPEAMRILRECAFEDIYYEHCSYFSPGSLARLFRRNNFEVLDLKTEYDGQYLTIEARPASGKTQDIKLPQENDLDELKSLVADFRLRAQKKFDHWHQVLEEARESGHTVALWGSGSKAVSFLTSLGVTAEVDHVVDINPHRWGHFMPGTGHPIVSPDQLLDLGPDMVIVMNRIYREEISRDLAKRGLTPSIVAL